MPLCLPSIALVDAITKQILVGVIYDGHRRELFTAVRGQGATMNGRPIRVGTQATLAEAVVAMGSPPAEESYRQSLRGIHHLLPKVRTIRMLGSAALMLAWVANGRLTAYWEYDLSAWDTAAGVLLVAEAGGTVTDLAVGAPFTVETRQLCASNGLIHADLLTTLRDEAGIR
jgi:myo-inositol-1(or 4)-monophosphatase